MEIIDRSALIIYSKDKMLSFINNLDSMKDEDDLTIEEINVEPSIFLIPEFDEEEEAYLYIEKNKIEIFKMMLLSWLEDGEISINLEEELFEQWFDTLITPVVNDLISSKIQKEELD